MDMTNHEMSALIEDGLIDYFRTISTNGNRPFVMQDRIGWVKTFPTAWPNLIFYADFDDGTMDAQISEITSKIAAGELPDEWVVGSKSKPANLCDCLVKHGFEEQSGMAGMAIDLTKIDENIVIPEGVNIIEVHGEYNLRIWADVVSKGLWNGGTFEPCLFQDSLTDPSIKLYLGFLDGEPVASSMLQLSNGIACINLVATLSQFWGRGIGTAMTKTPLIYARDMGYRISILQASSAGEHGYRKIGYKEYCKLHVYKYKNR